MIIEVIEPSVVFETPLDGFPELLERLARTCYKSEGKIEPGTADPFLRRHRNHQGIFEHAYVTVRFICDRRCSHQLVRHRIASYLQESQRFCDYARLGLQVIAPPCIAIQVGDYDINHLPFGLSLRQRCWLYVIGQSYAEYIAERKEGIPAEEAASVLPGATKTEIVTTMNLRSWRNVFHERALNPRAQQQIRSLTQQVLDRFIEKLPWCFDDLRG